ncbi:hypothetical protein RN001_000016 [Aquatica leii]|uniref:Uncharacterized protein n=1 Tax=Aquatica leii TaxID=1421715 RepID=A0AAN7Q9B5_9COLE|nr:hypothetical protein RN001_000016 [Aquatica leii]
MHSYTFYCVLLICFVQTICLEIPDELLDKDILECMEKAKIDKKLVQKITDENFHVGKGNSQFNEYFECVATSRHMVTETGEFNREVLHNDVINILLPIINKKDKNEVAYKIVDECMDIKNDNLGHRMIELHNCLVDAANKH